jgi:hypothetical protein
MKTMTRSLPSTSTYDSTHHRVQPCSFLARPYELDDFIHANAAAGRHRQRAHHGMLKVVLGPRAPGDNPDVEPMQVVKILLRLAEEHHLPSLRPCADLTGASPRRGPRWRRRASISTPDHPGKPPQQGSVLIVVRGQLQLTLHSCPGRPVTLPAGSWQLR